MIPEKNKIPEELLGGDITSVLLPYQARLYSLVLENEIVGVDKSRRIGVTWGLGSLATLFSAAARTAGGMDTIYIGYALDMTREFIDCCGMWAKAFIPAASEVSEFLFKDQDKPNGEEKYIKSFRIDFASGFEIMALSSAPRSLRGKQGLVIIDEAAFHDNFEELMKAAIALLMWGGKVVVVSTQNGFDNPYNEFLMAIKKDPTKGTYFKCDFDQALAEGLFKRISLVKGEEWSPEAESEFRDKMIAFYGEGAEEELFCVPKDGSGTALTRALIEKNMRDDIPVVRWEMKTSFAEQPKHIREAECRDFCERELLPLLVLASPELRSCYGQDFGRSGDLSVAIAGQISRNLVRRALFHLELRNIPFKQQEQILKYICDRLPRLSGVAMDARGNGQSLAEFAMQEYGSQIVDQVMLSIPWYRENMAIFKSAFEDNTIQLARDDDTMTDLRQLVIEKGVMRLPEKAARTKGKDGGQRHGDAAIALALFYVASLTNAIPMEFTSTGVNRSRGYAEGNSSEIDTDVGFGAVRRVNHLSGF